MSYSSTKGLNVTNVTITYYKEKMTLTYFLIAILLLLMLDLGIDFFAGMPLRTYIFEIALEGTIITTIFFMTRYIWRKFAFEKEERANIEKDLKKTKMIADEWEHKSKALMNEFQGLILRQLDLWGLSKSEKEIALMILQGKSSKEIATYRFTSERTIRNQCRAIYEKTKTSGKIGLITYFFSQLAGDLTLKMNEV